MKYKLTAERCDGDDEMMRKCHKSDSAISKLKDGTRLMVDISTLGWVVLKSSVPSCDKNKLQLLAEMHRLLDRFKKTRAPGLKSRVLLTRICNFMS